MEEIASYSNYTKIRDWTNEDLVSHLLTDINIVITNMI
jgi:hypothetical protein